MGLNEVSLTSSVTWRLGSSDRGSRLVRPVMPENKVATNKAFIAFSPGHCFMFTVQGRCTFGVKCIWGL